MTETMYKSKYYKLRKENGYLIVTNNKLELFFLDDVCSDIYMSFFQEKTINQVTNELVQNVYYDVDQKVLYKDVEALVKDLVDKGLLVSIC